MKVSLICVYNNEKIYKSQLLDSVTRQDIQVEVIAVNNTNHEFASAAKALDYGVNKSTGDILIFSHQDITLKTNDQLRKFINEIEKCNVGDIIGTQGVREKEKKYYSNITAGDVLDDKLNYQFIDSLIEVDCVDEGFFGMKRSSYESHRFDSKICDDWHLYCVEQCLHARCNGSKVYVCPIQLHHYSYGRISINYMVGLRRLCRLYRSDFRYIWTTCYKVRTNEIYIDTLIFLWVLNRLLRGRKLR